MLLSVIVIAADLCVVSSWLHWKCRVPVIGICTFYWSVRAWLLWAVSRVPVKKDPTAGLLRTKDKPEGLPSSSLSKRLKNSQAHYLRIWLKVKQLFGN